SGDSTYLRMQASGCSTTPSGTSGCRTIESPDGSRYEFHRYGSGALDWKLTTYSDAFGNDLTVTYSGGDWTLTDSHGRSHMVDFDAQGRVDEVRMEGVGTGTVTYDLQYGSATLIDRQEYARPAFCVPAAPGDEVGVTFLDRLVMPDGSFYGFSYFDNDLVAQDTLSGGLATLRLPTGGEVATPIGEISSSASPHRAAAILGCAPTAWPRAACSRIRALRPRVPGPTI
ncbi:MAG: hypothetical protein MPN21_23120, partial [Thermoanaerobaculia bacterium]|nr:hypothetical protein [Thermoanaerobaculia bacterium]